jgi:DNA-binding PadR family transcriptional regulator
LDDGKSMPSPLDDLGRFSDPALLILSSLSDGPKHGYAMMQDIQEFSGILLEPGTLYGAISRLEHRGWIVPLPSRDRRRPYQITSEGQAALRERLNSIQRVLNIGFQRLKPLSTIPGVP